MMKDFFKKLSKNQNEVEDLDTGYDSEYYQGSYDRREEERPEARPTDRPEDRYDAPRYEEARYDDRRMDDRRVDDRRVDDRYDAPRGWQENDAPAYRERSEAKAEPVFTPAPAPEYLYFTPKTYRDCREAIVRGLSSGHVVVVRLSKLEAGDVLRLFDYMMGAVLALDGELARPHPTTVVLLPSGVELDEDILELEDEDEYEEDEDAEYDEDEYEDEDEDAEYDEEYEEDYDEDEYDGEYDEEDSDSDAE